MRGVIKLTTVLFAFSAMAMGFVATTNVKGYCLAEGRRLSDEEKIDSVVRLVIRESNAVLATPERSGLGTLKPIVYSSVAEFKNENPECCTVNKIGDEGRHQTLLDRIMGQGGGYVHMKYHRRHLLPSGETYFLPVTAYVPVTNCGISELD